MLVLSRKVGETIVIGDNVTVTVLSVKGNRVKLGIEAPRGVRVVRYELTVSLTPGNLPEQLPPPPPRERRSRRRAG